MNRRQADVLVGGLVAVILVVGVLSTLQLAFADDSGMGHMESVPAIHFVGPLFGSLVVAMIIGGIYVAIRDRLFHTDRASVSGQGTVAAEGNDTDVDPERDHETVDNSTIYRRHPILDILPDDEERILEPVLESPGLTQTEVCDRSGFSRSKVSQTITDLEQRGLLYREPQGRTYRVYPADDLDDRI